MQSFKYCTGTYLYLDRVGIFIRRSPFCGCLCARQREEAWTFIGWLLTASHHSMSVFCLLLYRTHLHIAMVTIIGSRSWMRDILIRDMADCHLQFWGISIFFLISVQQQVFGKVKWFSGESSVAHTFSFMFTRWRWIFENYLSIRFVFSTAHKNAALSAIQQGPIKLVLHKHQPGGKHFPFWHFFILHKKKHRELENHTQTP